MNKIKRVFNIKSLKVNNHLSTSSIIFQLDNGLHNGGGFFSVFFFLCNAYIESKRSKRKFYITHNNWPYTYENGWHDYFTSLETCKGDIQGIVCSHMNVDKTWNCSLLDYKTAIHELFKLTPPLLDKISHIKKTLGKYKSIFIRRGDKILESSPVHVNDILKNIKYDKNTVFFIQTDDYSVIEEIKIILPNNKIVSTVSPNKRGSYHSIEFKRRLNVTNTKSLEEKDSLTIKDETEEMLVGLMVCVESEECWTDDTSNVGRFLKLYSPDNVNFYPLNYNINFFDIKHPAWDIR